MPAVALTVLFSGYAVAWWGWTLVKNYDITVPDLLIPNRYKGKWPPPQRATVSGGAGVPFTVPGSSSTTGSGTTLNA